MVSFNAIYFDKFYNQPNKQKVSDNRCCHEGLEGVYIISFKHVRLKWSYYELLLIRSETRLFIKYASVGKGQLDHK